MNTAAWMLLLALPRGVACIGLAAGTLDRRRHGGRFAFGRRHRGTAVAPGRCAAERESGWLRYATGLLLFNGLGVLAVYALQRLAGACCR